jgi:hypothetical protein
VPLVIAQAMAARVFADWLKRHNEQVEGRATDEMRGVLSEQVEAIRARPYAEHVARIPARGPLLGFLPPEHDELRELRTAAGETYDVKVETGWADRPGGDVEVRVLVAAGGFAMVASGEVRIPRG